MFYNHLQNAKNVAESHGFCVIKRGLTINFLHNFITVNPKMFVCNILYSFESEG